MKPTYCVAVADARRARIFELRRPDYDGVEESARLVEISDLVHPERRLRDAETFTDSRPGLRQGAASATTHGVDDGRDAHRDEDDRRFAERIAAEIAARIDEIGATRVVLAASHHMLGLLRACSVRIASEGTELVELPQELTNLTAPQLYRHLVGGSYLP